jgi:hypothetical protein
VIIVFVAHSHHHLLILRTVMYPMYIVATTIKLHYKLQKIVHASFFQAYPLAAVNTRCRVFL